MSDERERNPLDGAANGPSSSGQTPDDAQPVELLSAYLDNDPDLDPALRAGIEARLEADAGLREIYAELDVIRQGLRELPDVPAPGNYHVTPRMLGIPEPAVLPRREPWYERHSGGLRWATGLAAILFVFVLGADLVVNSLSGPAGDDDDADDAPTTSQLRAAEDADAGGGEAASGATEASGGGDEAGLSAASGAAEPTEAEMEAADGPAESAPPAEDGEAAEEEAGEAVEPEADSGAAPETTVATLDFEPTATAGPAIAQDDAAVEQPASDADSDEPEAQTFALEQDSPSESTSTNDGNGDLRIWRIVEFGLVAVLGVLLTATVVLPRMGARGRGGR